MASNEGFFDITPELLIELVKAVSKSDLRKAFKVVEGIPADAEYSHVECIEYDELRLWFESRQITDGPRRFTPVLGVEEVNDG